MAADDVPGGVEGPVAGLDELGRGRADPAAAIWSVLTNIANGLFENG